MGNLWENDGKFPTFQIAAEKDHVQTHPTLVVWVMVIVILVPDQTRKVREKNCPHDKDPTAL